MMAAKAARDKAIELARTGRDAPFADADSSEVIVRDGRLVFAKKNLEITYAELLARTTSIMTVDGIMTQVRKARR